MPSVRAWSARPQNNPTNSLGNSIRPRDQKNRPACVGNTKTAGGRELVSENRASPKPAKPLIRSQIMMGDSSGIKPVKKLELVGEFVGTS